MTAAEEHRLLQETHDAVIEIQTHCGACTQSLLNLQREMHGNGGEGLKTQVAKLKDKIGSSRWLERLVTYIVLALLGGILAVAGVRELRGGPAGNPPASTQQP